jgi:hypothetical protein
MTVIEALRFAGDLISHGAAKTTAIKSGLGHKASTISDMATQQGTLVTRSGLPAKVDAAG